MMRRVPRMGVGLLDFILKRKLERSPVLSDLLKTMDRLKIVNTVGSGI